jgi:hypothetical protein
MVDYAEIRELSVDELKAELLELWSALDLTEPLHFGEGSLPGLIYEAIPRLANRFSRMAVASKMLTLGEVATGEALDLWSHSVYGHKRKQSTSFVYGETLTCAPGNGPHTFTLGSAVVTNGSATYRLTAPPSGESWPVTLAGGQSKTFQVTCETPGEDGKADLGTINRMVTTYLGVTCSNTSLITTGEPSETDDQLKLRNRTIWATRNPFALTADAYVYYALNAHSAVRRARVVDDNPRGMYTVDLIIAGSTGEIASDETVVIPAVQAAIFPKILKPFRERLLITKATALAIPLVGPVYYYSGFELANVQKAISDAISNLAATIPIGGEYFEGYGNNRVLRAQIEKAIEGANIDGQPCVKLAQLPLVPLSTTLEPTQVATLTPSFGTSGLALIPVVQ